MTPPPSPPSSCVTCSNGSSRPDSGPPAPRRPHRRGRRIRRTPPCLPAGGPAGAVAGPDAPGPIPESRCPVPAAAHPGTATPHGVEFIFGQPDTWGTSDTETVIDTRVYDTTTARPWDRLMTVGTIRAYGAINADRHSVRWDMNADVTKMKRLLRLRSPGCGRCLCMEFWHICAVIAGVPSDSKRSADAPSPTGSERGIQASGLSGCRSRWSTR